MARAPVSKTGGWGFESLHSCQSPGINNQCSVIERRGGRPYDYCPLNY